MSRGIIVDRDRVREIQSCVVRSMINSVVIDHGRFHAKSHSSTAVYCVYNVPFSSYNKIGTPLMNLHVRRNRDILRSIYASSPAWDTFQHQIMCRADISDVGPAKRWRRKSIVVWPSYILVQLVLYFSFIQGSGVCLHLHLFHFHFFHYSWHFPYCHQLKLGHWLIK